MEETVSIWYDQEGDYLEVLFAHRYFQEPDHDAVMEKVDEAGQIIGFSILKVSALKGQAPLTVTLKKSLAEHSLERTASRVRFEGFPGGC